MKSVEDSNGFFMYPWLFLREVLGDLYEGLAYLSSVGRSSTNCCMIIYQLVDDKDVRRKGVVLRVEIGKDSRENA